MSTTPVPAPAAIHPNWFAKAITWVKHEGSVVKNAVIWLAQKEPAVADAITKIAPTIEGVTAMFSPGAAAIEQVGVNLLASATSAVHAAGDAAGANGLSLTLDAALVADIKALLPAIQKYLSPAASSAPPPPSA